MPDEVIFYAVEMLEKLMQTQDVAIYNVVNKDYARIFSASSGKARSLGNSIRYKEMTEIYEDLSEQKVYINKTMDERYPLMVRAVYEGGQIQMMIMLWGLSWEKMTLGQANFLTVVSYLIQNAVLRSQRYMQALEEKRYTQGSRLLETDAFESLVQAYMDGGMCAAEGKCCTGELSGVRGADGFAYARQRLSGTDVGWKDVFTPDQYHERKCRCCAGTI